MNKDKSPQSRQIAEELRRQIESGSLPPGSVLKSERELISDYDISRSTANKVVALLKSTGLVESQVGRGVFVKRRSQLVRHVHDRYSRRYRDQGKAPFRAEVESQGRTARVDVTGIDQIEPPQWVADRLGLAPDELVIRRENTYFVDNRPVQVVTTYIPASIGKGTALEKVVPGPGGIYATFENIGHKLTRMLEEVQSRMPRTDEAERLEVPTGTPVLDVLHISYDQDETPMDLSHFILRGDENVLTYELPTE